MLRRLMLRWRLACGLRWAKPAPYARDLGIDAHGVLFLLFVLAAYGLAGSLDYAEEQRQEAAAALDRAALHQAALLACLNGGAPGLYTIDDDGHRHYIVCDQPYTISDENAPPRKRQS